MKRIFVLAFVALSYGLQAQSPFLPYNPDENADGLIGVADLQGLLSQYGSEFSASVLGDNIAFVRLDNCGLIDCRSNCKALPGPWSMVGLDVVAENINQIAELVPVSAQYSTGSQNYMWYGDGTTSGTIVKYFAIDEVRALSTSTSTAYTPRSCLCYVSQYPSLEYDFCYLEALPGDDADFRECVEAKASAGWVPVSGVAQDYGRMYQAFWRWAQ